MYLELESQASTEPWADVVGAIVAGGRVGEGKGCGGVTGTELCEAGVVGVWVLVSSAGEAGRGVWELFGIGAPLMLRNLCCLASAC